jgi:putative oxidoreductase
MKTLYKKLVFARPAWPDCGLLLLRRWFGLTLALAHGLPKASNIPRFIDVVASKGIPLPQLTAPFALVSELAGGLLLALGLFTRAAGVCVAVTLLIAAWWVHGADPFAKKELAMAYAVVGLALAAIGPGRYSVDSRL